MSDEDNKQDTNYINKHKYTNHDTHKLHLLVRHVERAVFVVHLLMSCHTHLMAQGVLESSSHPHAIHERLSLTSTSSLSTSTCPFPSSSTSPSLCTLSSTPTSTTWTPCNTTCAPPRRGATTPTTSPSPSQVMSPTTWSSKSSATPRVPSPTLLSHRTWTLTTPRSASCSLKHTENMPITEIRKACPSVSRHCLSCSIRETCASWQNGR